MRTPPLTPLPNFLRQITTYIPDFDAIRCTQSSVVGDEKFICITFRVLPSPRALGRPRTTWMKTIQQDLKSNNLSLDEEIDVAQNRPLWRVETDVYVLALRTTSGACQKRRRVLCCASFVRWLRLTLVSLSE